MSEYVECVADIVRSELPGRPVTVEGRTIVFPEHHQRLHPFTRLVAPGAGSSAVAAARLRVKLLEKEGADVPRGIADLATGQSGADHTPGDNSGAWRWGTGQSLVDERGRLVTGRSRAAEVAVAAVAWWRRDVVDRGWLVTSRGRALWVNAGDDDAPNDVEDCIVDGVVPDVGTVVDGATLLGVAAALRAFATDLEMRAIERPW